MEDVEMLLGLRHHAVVGGDGEEYEVDAVRAGEHVADEALVPGDVDDAGAGIVGKGEVGEAEIDRNAALLFFFEAVGVLAGERFDERGLAVIDMTGGADDGVGDGGGHFGADVTPRGWARAKKRRRETRMRTPPWVSRFLVWEKKIRCGAEPVLSERSESNG